MKKWTGIGIMAFLLCTVVWYFARVDTLHAYKTLDGRGADISSVAFSPDGKLLATCSYDNIISVWDIKKELEIYTINNPEHFEPRKACFSPDGKILASIGDIENAVCLWDAGSGKLNKQLALNRKGRVYKLCYSTNGKMLAVAVNGDVIVFSLPDGQIYRKFKADKDYVPAIAFSPDNKILATGGNGIIKFWNIQDGKITKSVKGHREGIWDIAFSPDGKSLVSGSEDKTIKLWSTKPLNLKWSKTADSQVVYSVAFSPDGKTIASGGHDTEVKLWNSTEGNLIFKLKDHQDQLREINFSPNGKVLSTGSIDGTVKLWKMP